MSRNRRKRGRESISPSREFELSTIPHGEIDSRPPSRNRRHGFTLMEVILALAILGPGLFVLNETIRLAQQCGRVARDLTYAQMLCEAKMNEFASGVTPLAPAQDVPFGAPYDGWFYTVETGDLEVPGLIAVTLTVTQDLPPEREPAIYTMVRWMGDPAVDAASSSSDSSNSSSSQNSSGTSGSTSGSSGSTGASGTSGASGSSNSTSSSSSKAGGGSN
jgi:prepilin-type N-terminal cleavage/methylation domain-containing protein